MLYQKNTAPELSDELFRNPTCEYRGTPFWSWNCELHEKELLSQIDILKEMGFGGFHMHCRAGMATEYLGDEFMDLVKSCVRKAKKENLLAWLYDEDRWPSGFAGGIVTKEEKYRGRYLIFSPKAPKEGEAHLDFGCYDVVLNEKGELASYRRLPAGEEGEGALWYAYEFILRETPRYNNQTYVDTLNRAAIERFIEVTHETYKKAVGKEFGKTVPAIFTDEPQFHKKEQLPFATTRKAVSLPFTDDLEETYRAAYGESLLDHLPELFWDLPGGAPSLTRYRYHAHVAARFAEAFADTCGDWCQKNGIALTGHMMEEPTLGRQTGMLGEAMPSYRGFQIPGIDMLCARYELNTAKQCQSATRQYGREGMMSELYGVTGWDFDFRGHKLGGDWQAAMGVTVRVHHLSWVSMEGEAKRDYPASISYQSPWFREYRAVEDHFSRLNTALTRGKPIVRVGVIHPVESYWLHFGPKEQNALRMEQLESNFDAINRYLTFGGYDFDYICESTLPEQCKVGTFPLEVGAMRYDAIVVPALETMRRTTVERLEAFRKAGGLLIFMGEAPVCMDAVPDARPAELAAESVRIPFSRADLLQTLEPVREVSFFAGDGTFTKDILYQMRQDGESRWLFLCHGANPVNKDISRKTDLHVHIRGAYRVKLYDTLTGEISDVETCLKNGETHLVSDLYEYDSLLLRLDPLSPDSQPAVLPVKEKKAPLVSLPLETPNLVPFTLDEPNALLLDLAECALDDGEYGKREEVLRFDTACREKLGWPPLSGSSAQPWCIPKEEITHSIRMRFTVQSDIHVYGVSLAIEHPEQATIVWNGKKIDTPAKGYYVDKAIRKVKLPGIRKGKNILELTVPFGTRTATEWCYLLGSFGTRVIGSETRIVPLAETIGYGDIVPQTLSFYSGALTYHLDTVLPEEADGAELLLTVPQYRGALVKAFLDGKEVGNVIYPPYRLSLGSASAGAHRIDLKLYVPRTNGFGPVHAADEKLAYPGPAAWRTKGEFYCYEYRLMKEGILVKPTLTAVR